MGVGSGSRNLSADGRIYASDWGIDFSTVRFPIRYWHGGRDKNIPASIVARFVQKLPGARLEVLDEDGHYSLPMLRKDEIAGELLGWK